MDVPQSLFFCEHSEGRLKTLLRNGAPWLACVGLTHARTSLKVRFLAALSRSFMRLRITANSRRGRYRNFHRDTFHFLLHLRQRDARDCFSFRRRAVRVALTCAKRPLATQNRSPRPRFTTSQRSCAYPRSALTKNKCDDAPNQKCRRPSSATAAPTDA